MTSEFRTSERQLILQLQGELAKYAFTPGEQFPNVEYCRFCHYSRDWVSKHGHTERCLLRSLTDEALDVCP